MEHDAAGRGFPPCRVCPLTSEETGLQTGLETGLKVNESAEMPEIAETTPIESCAIAVDAVNAIDAIGTRREDRRPRPQDVHTGR